MGIARKINPFKLLIVGGRGGRGDDGDELINVEEANAPNVMSPAERRAYLDEVDHFVSARPNPSESEINAFLEGRTDEQRSLFSRRRAFSSEDVTMRRSELWL